MRKIILITGVVLLVVILIGILFFGIRKPESTDLSPIDTSLGSGDFQSDEHIDVHEHDGLEPSVTRLLSNELITDVSVPDTSPEWNKILQEFYLDTYLRMQCGSGDEIEEVFMLTAKDVTDQRLVPAETAVKVWESKIMSDIGNVLFPGVSSKRLSSATFQESIVGTDSTRATYLLDGKRYEIHYGWVLNYLFFTTSKACLDASRNEVYAPHGH